MGGGGEVPTTELGREKVEVDLAKGARSKIVWGVWRPPVALRLGRQGEGPRAGIRPHPSRAHPGRRPLRGRGAATWHPGSRVPRGMRRRRAMRQAGDRAANTVRHGRRRDRGTSTRDVDGSKPNVAPRPRHCFLQEKIGETNEKEKMTRVTHSPRKTPRAHP